MGPTTIRSEQDAVELQDRPQFDHVRGGALGLHPRSGGDGWRASYAPAGMSGFDGRALLPEPGRAAGWQAAGGRFLVRQFHRKYAETTMWLIATGVPALTIFLIRGGQL